MCVTEPEMDTITSHGEAPNVILPTDDCYMTSSMTSDHRGNSSDDSDPHAMATTTTSKKSSRTKSQDLNNADNSSSTSPTKKTKSATKRTFTAADLLEIEDKELRKKLRNRQSALAARERKKARMLELEKKVAELQESYRLIEDENQFLRARLENVIKQCESMGVQINGLDQNQHPSDMFPIIDFNNPKYHTTSTTANSPASTTPTNDCSSKATNKKIQVKLEPHHQSSSAPVSPKTTNEFPMAAPPSSVGGRSNSSSCVKQVSIFDPCFNSNSSSQSDEPQFEYQQLCNSTASTNYHHNHHHFEGGEAKKRKSSAQHKLTTNHVIFGADENLAADHNQMHATAHHHHNNSLPSIDVVLKSSKKLNNKYSSSPTNNPDNYQSNKMCHTGDVDENNSDLRLNWFQYSTNNTQRLRSQSDESPFCKQEDLLHHENSSDKNNKNNLTLPILPNEILYTINSDCDIFDGINSPTSFFETVAIHSSVDDSPGSFSAVSPAVDSACGLPDLLSDTCKGLDNISNDSGQSSIDAWVLDNAPTSLYEF